MSAKTKTIIGTVSTFGAFAGVLVLYVVPMFVEEDRKKKERIMKITVALTLASVIGMALTSGKK